MFEFSQASKGKLALIDERLARVATAALAKSPVDFGIAEGLRSIEDQKIYFEKGLSEVMNSKHLTGSAIDIYLWIDGKASYERIHFRAVIQAFVEAAHEEGLCLRYGFLFRTLEDSAHIEIHDKSMKKV